MLPCCNTWVGGRTGSLPLALSGSGSGIIQRRAEASARLGERANAVDERRDGSPLSPCLMPSAKTYFAAIDVNRRRCLGVVRVLNLIEPSNKLKESSLSVSLVLRLHLNADTASRCSWSPGYDRPALLVARTSPSALCLPTKRCT